ncbi:hypothetical protein BDW59DRAFT_162863 [Aspergillus cavernicola]|uniref:UBA domain-containing protein Ucp14 n=1 Tax=Aspergillus cavernicola TaxID=176166 RepID=A0ABR4I825_9EURO
MQTSGLTNTPLTKTLLIYTIVSSIALSIFDIKHVPVIHVSPHLLQYGQFWRALIWQVAGFANSTEVLFAALLVYHLRVVERGWGGRKLATFILSTLPYTTLLPPLLLTFLLRPITWGKMNYLPSGLTATIFALLAQYHASIPSTCRYTISTSSTPTPSLSPSNSATSSSPPPTSEQTSDSTSNNNTIPPPTEPPASAKKSLTISLSDKSTTYLIATQLALSQFPYMLLPSVVGWIVGVAWRADVLPLAAGSGGGWRVPGWFVGEERVMFSLSTRGERGAGVGDGGRFENMRRRLESEAAAAASGSSNSNSGSGGWESGSGSGSGSGSSRQRVVRG